MPPDAERMKALADRLKMSTGEMLRLRLWAEASAASAHLVEVELAKRIYRGDRQAVIDRLRLALASARARAVESNDALLEAGGFSRLLNFVEHLESPEFPLKGGDLVLLGARAGPEVGKLLRNLENDWVDAGFVDDRDALLQRAARAISAIRPRREPFRCASGSPRSSFRE